MIRGQLELAVSAGATQEAACAAIGLDPRTVQRWAGRADGDRRAAAQKKAPAHQLTKAEAVEVLRTLNTPEFRDLPPNVVVAILADHDVYLASPSTMYRLLRVAGQLAHRTTAKPPTKRHKPAEACASAPNQVWSWDITYLSTTVRGVFLRLYVVLDVFSRKIVGWSVHAEETADHAARLLAKIVAAEGARPGLVLHSDNGAPMKGCTMLAMLEQLGVVPSFSRPRVSNDNPYSEATFRTLKHCPQYPADGVFADLAAAEAWTAAFVDWYNGVHRHSGIKFVTPNERHAGLDTALLARRAEVFAAAKLKNPRRWTGDIRDWSPITEVRLNPDADPAKPAA